MDSLAMNWIATMPAMCRKCERCASRAIRREHRKLYQRILGLQPYLCERCGATPLKFKLRLVEWEPLLALACLLFLLFWTSNLILSLGLRL